MGFCRWLWAVGWSCGEVTLLRLRLYPANGHFNYFIISFLFHFSFLSLRHCRTILKFLWACETDKSKPSVCQVSLSLIFGYQRWVTPVMGPIPILGLVGYEWRGREMSLNKRDFYQIFFFQFFGFRFWWHCIVKSLTSDVTQVWVSLMRGKEKTFSCCYFSAVWLHVKIASSWRSQVLEKSWSKKSFFFLACKCAPLVSVCLNCADRLI